MVLKTGIRYDCETKEQVEYTYEEEETPIVEPEAPQPTIEAYLLDYEFRISMLELGGEV